MQTENETVQNAFLPNMHSKECEKYIEIQKICIRLERLDNDACMIKFISFDRERGCRFPLSTQFLSLLHT